VLGARREDQLKDVVNKCKELGGEAIYVVTDVSKEEECKRLIEQAVQQYGTIDLLVREFT
jgi:NADP-dependent 3-hydroxy acid dehydrogenase YdfG